MKLPQSCTPFNRAIRQGLPRQCQHLPVRQTFTQRRTFLPNPFSRPQSLAASRTLSYPSKIIYEVITDVASYKHFIPYCIDSQVLQYSNPAPDGKKYPEEAKLLIGFNGDVSESFWSRVYCVPETIVETVAGSTDTSLPARQIEHHNPRPAAADDPVRKGNVMKHLSTKWTLKPFPYKPAPASARDPSTSHKNTTESSSEPGHEKTQVSLTIDYEFANPVYAALSAATSSVVADKMMEAFEKRVKIVVAEANSKA